MDNNFCIRKRKFKEMHKHRFIEMFMTHNNITFCLKIPYFTINTVLHTHPLKFSNLVIVHTLDFWYMIKTNKQPKTQHWNFAIFWTNSQPNWTSVWASKTFVWNKTSERVLVGNWADKRFVQNVSKIPPLRFRLLIYFLSYTERLQLANSTN